MNSISSFNQSNNPTPNDLEDLVEYEITANEEGLFVKELNLYENISKNISDTQEIAKNRFHGRRHKLGEEFKFPPEEFLSGHIVSHLKAGRPIKVEVENADGTSTTELYQKHSFMTMSEYRDIQNRVNFIMDQAIAKKKEEAKEREPDPVDKSRFKVIEKDKGWEDTRGITRNALSQLIESSTEIRNRQRAEERWVEEKAKDELKKVEEKFKQNEERAIKLDKVSSERNLAKIEKIEDSHKENRVSIDKTDAKLDKPLHSRKINYIKEETSE